MHKPLTITAKKLGFLWSATTAFVGLLTSPSFAEDAIKTPAHPADWWGTFAATAQLEAGGTENFSSPNNNKNFGRLFDDKANGAQLNQTLITAQRPMDANSKDYDIGFILQAMYGSDARYSQFLHETQNIARNDHNQVDVVQALVQLHTPWCTDGGLDFQIGQYVSPEGAETLDPSTNYFYSHSYIFNFGVPLKNTGILANLHLSPMINIEAGVDTGVNTGIGGGDNNDRLAFQGAIGINLLGGNLTSLISTHIGPEIASNAVTNGLVPATVDSNSALRSLSDITTTWKASDHWTLINDINWIHDDALNAGRSANGYGVAQYAVFKIDENWSLAGRAEIFHDVNGVFVTQSGNNSDFLRGEEGLPSRSSQSVGGGKTNYGALTAGVNYKADLGLPHITNFMIRPELRYDTSLNGTRPFNDQKDKNMYTLAVDFIIAFQ